MPVYHVVDTARGLVHTICQGPVAAEDFLEARAALAGDPEFRPDMNQLIDLRTATVSGLDGARVRDLAARTVFQPGSRKALVVASDVTFGLARMYELSAGRAGASHGDIRVFRDLDAAFAWLGVRMPRSNGSR